MIFLNRSMTAISLVITMAIGITGVAVAHRTEKPEFNHDISDLKAVTSFEVYQFHGIFEVEDNRVPAEIINFVSTALSHNPAMPKASPADAVIVLECVRNDCGKVRALVRKGHADGPVIWHVDADNYWFYTGDEFYSEARNPRKVAKELIKKLSADYADLNVTEQMAEI